MTQLLLYRLDPKSGKLLWEHDSRGAPVSLDFQGRDILVLRPEKMDVLSYWAW